MDKEQSTEVGLENTNAQKGNDRSSMNKENSTLQKETLVKMQVDL